MIDNEYLAAFQQRLQESLLRLCHDKGMGGMMLLSSDDIDDLWLKLAEGYIADAVPEIAQYPVVSLAWASFLGMAVAEGWDRDWTTCSSAPYSTYYGSEGFDNMDEHILRDILLIPLDGAEAEELNAIVRSCGQHAVDAIRREQIEPQSSQAFHVFARACTCMYRIGAHLQLLRMGYKMEKQDGF